MDILETLNQLCSVGAPSGFEEPAAQVAAELLRPLVDEVRIDRLGSVIGVKRCGRENAKKLVLDAHLDEVGLIVTGIEKGFLRFRSIGGVDPRILPDREVTVLADKHMMVVVVCLPPHILKPEEREKSIPISDLFIDVGLSQERAEELIPIGTPIVYRESAFALGEKQVCGKSMDDRACFTCLLRTAEILKDVELDVDLYIMGSTFEEVSGAGAAAGTYAIDPDWCVAVDVTHGKTPDSPADRTCVLGGGPAIGIGPNMTRWMTNRMKSKAKEKGIACQYEVMGGHTGTNGWHMQVARKGIPTSVLSLPLKYMHTPVEVLDLSDVEALSRLLAAFATDLGKEAESVC